MSPCPEPERLAAYLDGRLFPEQRERLEEHLAGCDACANAIAESLRFEGMTAPPRASYGGRWAAAAAVVLVVVPTTMWLASRVERPPWQRDPRAPLIAATAEARPLTPRLTGGFRWAPPRETVRSASALPAQEIPWSVYAAADLIREQARSEPSSDRLGALADAHLLAGDVDRALVTLARATAEDPADPRLRSDIAAAYLARAQSQGTAADFAEALDTASAVLAVAPNLIEARFNRALALEGLHLDAEARRAWETYLAAETDPQWAAEAKRHLRDLPTAEAPISAEPALRRAAETGDPVIAQLVAGHRLAARRLVEWQLLPEWGTARASGDADGARRALVAAAAIAREYAKQTGEGRVADEVAEATTARGAAAGRLAAAHRALAAGELAIERMDVESARKELARAVSSFEANSIGWRRATVEQLIAEFLARGREGELLAKIERRAEMSGDDLPTGARLAWLEGNVAGSHADVGKAIGSYLEALAAFDRLGEIEPAAWMHNLLGEAYALAGDQRSRWQHVATAVAAAPALEDRRRSFGILLGAATWSLLSGRPWLADAFLDELGARDYATHTYEQAYLLVWRARVSLQLGDRARGTSELAHAALATRALDPSPVRGLLEAEVGATRSTTAVSSGREIAAISGALETFRSRGVSTRLPGLLLQRSLAYRSAGDSAAAERDLRDGIALLEQQPRLGPRDEVLVSRFDRAQTLYDEMIAVELGRNRPDEAFLWSERGRRRGLARYAGAATAVEPIKPARVERELDEATTLLSYALVGDTAWLWQVDSHGTRLVRLPTSATEITSWVALLDADLTAGEWTARSAAVARQLHDALIAPAKLAPVTKRLVIVPDKRLATLPFSALLDRTSTFLLQSYTVEVAPSAAHYLHARARWRSLAGERPSALVVGNPRADEKLFPGLTALPGAADEARRVAALYPDSLLIIGERATRDALVEGFGKHSIVHLATHALVDEATPSRSALALAARVPGDGTGALFADEISRIALADTRTVVLASCGGTAGPHAAVEGRLSLPYAFLSADVPTVVVALWPVGDRRSVELLAGMHAELRAGEDPASALRSAQLRLLGGSDPSLRSPATWALFQALGG